MKNLRFVVNVQSAVDKTKRLQEQVHSEDSWNGVVACEEKGYCGDNDGKILTGLTLDKHGGGSVAEEAPAFNVAPECSAKVHECDEGDPATEEIQQLVRVLHCRSLLCPNCINCWWNTLQQNCIVFLQTRN